MKFNRSDFDNEELLSIYKSLILPRLIEEKMLIYLRQGKISKWFSGWGQEGISVGCTYAMDKDEYILPMHRNLGVFTTRNIPLQRLFSQFQGKSNGFTKGRDRSFHFGSQAHRIIGMISHLGPQMGIADGIGLAEKLKKSKKSTLVFTGDGGASEGDFHEAINVAAVWDLPVIFVVENNCWGLSTPSDEQYRFKNFVDKGIGYGIKARKIDGNNILEVISAIRKAREEQQNSPAPILLELMSFRMRGHEEASGTKYYPEGLQDKWIEKDPVSSFSNFLIQEKVLSKSLKNEIEEDFKNQITLSFKNANEEPLIEPSLENELNDVFYPFDNTPILPQKENLSEKRFIDAISDSLSQSMEKNSDMVIMGQDIAEYGGAFKVTEGFIDKFGKDRVRNTPLCESAIVGASLGLSISGIKSVMEMQFSDFVTCGFNQIVNNLAKIHWRWGQKADVVIRMPTGGGTAAGSFHSQSIESWFFHTPGLKIVYPSSPYDAKGLLNASIEDPNPVLYFEHKVLYRSIKENIPDDYYTLEIGKAKTIQKGNDISIITYGMGVHWALELSRELTDISIDIIDLKTLLPLDKETIYQSVEKTGKALVLHEACMTGGIGAEIAALISEFCFEKLDAPVKRVASLDTAVPFAEQLEKQFMAKSRLSHIVKELIEY
ncbi:MAG: dehydrogenase E1 component subunit alpha/beta [Crocinitomicaceae bacterium]|nr:dehydrogenase E1 component subunit alpha/beta [Crocinitomicaceae bacterium]